MNMDIVALVTVIVISVGLILSHINVCTDRVLAAIKELKEK